MKKEEETLPFFVFMDLVGEGKWYYIERKHLENW
jgi:hypothetical protein